MIASACSGNSLNKNDKSMEWMMPNYLAREGQLEDLKLVHQRLQVTHLLKTSTDRFIRRSLIMSYMLSVTDSITGVT